MHVRDVIRHLDRFALTPIVCSLSDIGPVGRELQAEGIEVIALGMQGRGGWAIVRELSRAIRERGIDIVHTHTYRSNLYGRLAAILARTPCIVASVHNQYKPSARKPMRRLINHLLAKYTNAIVAVSEPVKADIVSCDRIRPSKTVVIPNGIDAEALAKGDRASARLSLGIPEDSQVIGAVGRLVEQKGFRYLIEAFAEIKANLPNSVLLIVGDGSHDAQLKELAARLGVRDSVTFAGMRRDIPDMLAAMDVYAMPSLYEGFGISLVEAMAAGKPVVATTIPPFMKILSHGETALLVPPKDPGALASAISRLLTDRPLALRLGQEARETAASRYDIEDVSARLRLLYMTCLKSAHLIGSVGPASCEGKYGNTINVISPHHDDACFSLGIALSRFLREGYKVNVINCYTVSSYTVGRKNNDASIVSAIRKEEDSAFISKLGPGASATDLGFSDSLNRGQAFKYSTRPIGQADSEELRQVAAALSVALKPGPILIPLSVGHHPNHRIAHMAGIQSRDGNEFIGFYEDLPYSANLTEAQVIDYVRDAETALGRTLSPLVISSDGGARLKARLAGSYVSQLGEKTVRKLARRAKRFNDGERLWLSEPLRSLLAGCLTSSPSK